MNAASRTELTVGFMPLLDCALLVVAHEAGLARQQGLSLRLVRETSWANIRDRLAVGHFDAAHMLGPMVIAQNLGIGLLDTPLVAPVALGTGGNAITVSRPLWSAMRAAGAAIGAEPAQQARALSDVVARRRAAGQPVLTLAMVYPFSCHNYQLRDWLGRVASTRTVTCAWSCCHPCSWMRCAAAVDGFCVGEPWNSLAVEAGIGVMPVVCSDLWPRQPEKVLGLRAQLAEENAEAVGALVRSIHAASLWASDPANHADLASLLSQPRYVGAPARLLHSALAGDLRVDAQEPPIRRPEFASFGPDDINPRESHAEMLITHMQRCGQLPAGRAAADGFHSGYRADLFQGALASIAGRSK
ncbi:MAG: CmpA/NrtA family ABC transporter substrate-binding protein [Steroidobacteraceae bacterium]